MQKSRKLKDIEVRELSLVNDPANERKFLFVKSNKKKSVKLDLGITSDGTVGGTVIKLNGEDLADVENFNFNLYNSLNNGPDSPVGCSYSKLVDGDNGFKRSETFWLSKAKGISMDSELVELLKSLFGDEVDFKKKADIGEDALKAVKSALKTLGKYKDDFPDDLKKAIGTLAKYASDGYGYPEAKGDKDKKEEEDKDKLKKAGAKFSKDTLTKLQEVVKAVEALKSILPELKEATQKSKDGDEKDELSKSLEELQKKLATLTKSVSEEDKSKGSEEIGKLTETIKSLTERLTTIEKAAGVKQGIDGQDDIKDDDNKDKKWPSLA